MIFVKRRFKLLLILSFSGLGLIYLQPSEMPPLISPSGPQLLSIVSEIKETPLTIQFIGKSENNEKILLMMFKNKNDSSIPPTWQHGANCTVIGEVERIEGARNPGQFNYQVYMANQGVFSKIEIDNEESLLCEGRSLLSYGFEYREYLMERVQTNVDPQSYAWIAALIFGERDLLEEDIIEWFRAFGLSHLLAISGLHVGLTIGGIYFLIVRTGMGTIEQARIGVILFLPLYCFLAGAEPSVIRASLMAFIILSFSIFKMKIVLTDLLSTVAFCLLIISPSYIDHVGFQFSFLVTLGLVLSMPLIPYYQNIWMQSALISLISQLSILPLQVHYFYEFNPLSLLANLILVPYFSFVVLPFLMLLLVLSIVIPFPIHDISSHIIALHDHLLSFMSDYSTVLNIQWIIGQIDPLYIILYLGIFIWMMIFWQQQKLLKAFLTSVLMVLVLGFYCLLPYMEARGTITMLDIGQGDSFVIELPFRKGIIMIDAAGPPIFKKNQNETVEQIIIPFLKSRGIVSIDALMISHEDSDHDGSASALLSQINVNNLIISPFYPVEGQQIKRIIKVKRGDRVTVADQHFYIYHPQYNAGNPNDNSMVFGSKIGGMSWLFTGDISKEMEEELIRAYPSLEADVLKVGHHGSDTSTGGEWIEHLSPSYAWISAGVDNRYGHPHQEVLERLENKGVTVYQTDERGAVQYIFSGQSGTFTTFLPYNASKE